MTVAVYVAIYAGLLLFLVGCLRRIYQYTCTPFHLRWELYPVPHEEPSRVQHGGSYFESGEWWLRPQAIHHRGEWIAMFREIVFLRGLWEFNPRLWLPSFLFHFGLYLSIVTVGLATAAAAGALIPGVASGRLPSAVFTSSTWIGSAAIVFVLVGAVWLLMRRVTDPALKNYTKVGDIFNLAFFIGTFACLAGGFFGGAANGASFAEVARGALRFDRGAQIGTVPGLGLILASALVAYIPFTHMSHFIAKYFTWHSVRWDDRRNARGGALESKIAASLRHRPTWAAPHLGADGKKSWAEIAASNPVEEVRK
ncbi:MAG TPA: respiratory nitrate reductase subunit gamma [Terracidiphilus sp.]|nr:respiratory nitrate reductase subunit gamma [Terracidiphilus sp.]